MAQEKLSRTRAARIRQHLHAFELQGGERDSVEMVAAVARAERCSFLRAKTLIALALDHPTAEARPAR